MRYAKENNTIDAIADEDDKIEVEVSDDIAGGNKLYVHVNGQTIIRIGHIKNGVSITKTFK